jgi:low affinity Fe/Cu permease
MQADAVQKAPNRTVLIITLIGLLLIQDFLQRKPTNIQLTRTERVQTTIVQNICQARHETRSVLTITGKSKSKSRNIENTQNNITKVILDHLICSSLLTQTTGRAIPTRGTTLTSPIKAYFLNL